MANEEMKEIVENISNDLVEPLQNDYFNMYNESILFLEELKKIVNKYTNNTNNNKISNNLRKEISDLYTSKNIQELNDENRKLESEIGILQAKFSSQIDRFLGRQITLTIVDENGNILLTDTEQEEEIMGNLSRSAFKDSGRGKMNITKESLDVDGSVRTEKVNADGTYEKTTVSSEGKVTSKEWSDADGTVRVIKFGYCGERTTNNVFTLTRISE